MAAAAVFSNTQRQLVKHTQMTNMPNRMSDKRIVHAVLPDMQLITIEIEYLALKHIVCLQRM